MKKVLLSCLAFLAITLLLFTLPFVFPIAEGEANNLGLPWEIEQNEFGQTRVFGISPGISTLDDAIANFGDDMELAIMVAANIPTGEEAKDAALEGYYSQVRLNFLQARLVLTLDASEQIITAMLARSPKAEYMSNGSRKYSLHPDDAALARTLPLAALTLIPGARLDEETITMRFGSPAAIVPVGENLQHYLYPDKGLDIAVDKKGKNVLQYVAPTEFEERIMRPLQPKT